MRLDTRSPSRPRQAALLSLDGTTIGKPSGAILNRGDTGIRVDNRVLVDETMQTSAPDVFAAGDVPSAWHPSQGEHLRVKHWANVLNQGRPPRVHVRWAGQHRLRRLAAEGLRDTESCFALALDDVRAAAVEPRWAYDGSDGRDGFISFECTPDLAE